MTARLRQKAKPLVPIPEVYVPFLAGIGAMIATWIATGEFSRLEAAQTFSTGWYALIGWSVHRKRIAGANRSAESG